MFRVGDIVKVKSWETLLSEFGYNSHGDISGPRDSFPFRIRQYCGKVFTITSVEDTEINPILTGLDSDGWIIYDWMVELVAYGPDIRVGDRVKMKSKKWCEAHGYDFDVSRALHLYGMEGIVVEIGSRFIRLDNPWFCRYTDGTERDVPYWFPKEAFIRIPND